MNGKVVIARDGTFTWNGRKLRAIKFWNWDRPQRKSHYGWEVAYWDDHSGWVVSSPGIHPTLRDLRRAVERGAYDA